MLEPSLYVCDLEWRIMTPRSRQLRSASASALRRLKGLDTLMDLGCRV
jgi:hypothetical protein